MISDAKNKPHISFEIDDYNFFFPLSFSPILSGRAYRTIHGEYQREDTGLLEFPGFSPSTVKSLAVETIKKGIVILGLSSIEGNTRSPELFTVFASDNVMVKGSFLDRKNIPEENLTFLPKKGLYYLTFSITKSEEYAELHRRLVDESIEIDESGLTAFFDREVLSDRMGRKFKGRLEKKPERSETKLYLLVSQSDSLKYSKRTQGELIPLETLL